MHFITPITDFNVDFYYLADILSYFEGAHIKNKFDKKSISFGQMFWQKNNFLKHHAYMFVLCRPPYTPLLNSKVGIYRGMH